MPCWWPSCRSVHVSAHEIRETRRSKARRCAYLQPQWEASGCLCFSNWWRQLIAPRLLAQWDVLNNVLPVSLFNGVHYSSLSRIIFPAHSGNDDHFFPFNTMGDRKLWCCAILHVVNVPNPASKVTPEVKHDEHLLQIYGWITLNRVKQMWLFWVHN